jgi:DnaJ-class molecular chaperone
MNFDYLDTLFVTDPAVIAANEAELARISAAEAVSKAADEARRAERIANRCPKCMGEGRIAQFTHRKGGECFMCGGSGVFSRYKG